MGWNRKWRVSWTLSAKGFYTQWQQQHVEITARTAQTAIRIVLADKKLWARGLDFASITAVLIGLEET